MSFFKDIIEYKKGGKVPAMKRNHGGECMKKGGNANFIKGMHMKEGALHRSVGVPADKNIPEKKIQKAMHSKNKTLAHRARAAEMLKGLRHK